MGFSINVGKNEREFIKIDAKILLGMRTNRERTRTNRGMVYKFKCALNECALFEVRTKRGIAVV